MNFQVNINLGLSGSSFSQAEVQRRFEVVNYLMKNNTDWRVLHAIRSDRQVEHMTQDCLVLEQVYVAEIDCCGYKAPTQDMLRFLHSLSDVLGQGCIAIYINAFQEGSLIGSDPGPWGCFDTDRFVFLSEVAA